MPNQTSAQQRTPEAWADDQQVDGHDPAYQRGYRDGIAELDSLRIAFATKCEELEARFNEIVGLRRANAELVVALEWAVARIEVANREGDTILSGWLPGTRAAIARARGEGV